MNQNRIVKHTCNAIFFSHVALECHTCAIWWTGVDYRRCYEISAANGELFVMIQLNPLPAYVCISAMDMSLKVSCVESCSHYNMYEVTDNSLMTPCIQTMEEPYTLFTYSQYRCQPALYLMFGWSGSFRLQNRMGLCDLRWNCDTCWSKWALSTTRFQRLLEISMVSCQQGPTLHTYAWQIGPFWQDIIDI